MNNKVLGSNFIKKCQIDEAKLSPFDISVLMKFADTDRERCFIIYSIPDFDTIVPPDWKVKEDETEAYTRSLKLLIDIGLLDTYKHPTRHVTPNIHLSYYGTDFVRMYLLNK